MTVQRKNKLVLFWERIEKAGDKIKIARQAKSLQRQAEIDVAKAQEDYESAKSALEKAKVDAKDNTESGFRTIVDKYMKVQIEKKKFDDAVGVYEELFEEKPRLLE
jgi:tetratricopeptide (TPR) repeat protein